MREHGQGQRLSGGDECERGHEANESVNTASGNGCPVAKNVRARPEGQERAACPRQVAMRVARRGQTVSECGVSQPVGNVSGTTRTDGHEFVNTASGNGCLVATSV